MRFTTPLMLVVLFVASLVAQVPQNGLVAWYTFDGGSLSNEVGPSLPLSEVPGESGVLCADRDGVAGNAYEFGDIYGTWGFWNAEDNLLPQGSDALTVCFWIASLHGKDAQEFILEWGDHPDNAFAVAFEHNNLVVYGYETKASVDVRLSITDDSGNWHHVAVAYAASRLRIYVDGGSVYNEIVGGGKVSSNSSSKLTIGADFDALDILDGRLDDVCIFNRALSSTEIYGIVNPTSVSMRPHQVIMARVASQRAFTISGRALQGTPRFQLSVSAEKKMLFLR